VSWPAGLLGSDDIAVAGRLRDWAVVHRPGGCRDANVIAGPFHAAERARLYQVDWCGACFPDQDFSRPGFRTVPLIIPLPWTEAPHAA